MKKYCIDKSVSFYKKTKKILPGGVHSNFGIPKTEPPIYFKKAEGSWIWDIDGNRYLDLYGKSGALLSGHVRSLSRLMEEYAKQGNLIGVDHTELDYKAICWLKKFIPSCESARFCLSGNEAVQNAFRLARAYTGKNKIIRFYGHFHGTADNLTGGVYRSKINPVPVDDEEQILYTKGRARGVLENEILILPWNDKKILIDIVEKYKDEVAAIISEPVCINYGSIMPADGYMDLIEQISHQNNILFILDEAITGVRLGLGGAQARYNIHPDLSIFSKCIGGGYVPISAIVGKKEILNLYSECNVVHGGTFNGYQLGLGAICHTYQQLSNTQMYHQLEIYSTQLHTAIKQTAKENGIELYIQGPAACASFHCSDRELVTIEEVSSTIMGKNEIVRKCLKEHGIFIDSFSRIYTNFCIGTEEIDFVYENAPNAFREAARIIEIKYGRN